MAKLPAKKVEKKETVKKTVVTKSPAKKVAGKKVTEKKRIIKKPLEPKKVAPKKVAVRKTKEIKTTEPALLLALTVAQGMFEKKAENIRILDMRKIPGASSDFFVISHAISDKQVDAIAKSVEEEVKKNLNENPLHREGYENMEWILLDYFNVVAHIFQEEKRDFYGIEQLWGDSENIEFKGK